LELDIYQIRDLVDIFIDNLETLSDGCSSVPPRTPELRGLAKESILDPKIHRIIDTSDRGYQGKLFAAQLQAH
jgi:hypothetical protein